MKHERKKLRLPDFDYSSDGAYFITICTKNRKHFFGEISNKKMILNEIGGIAFQYLDEIPKHFLHAIMDEFIVMPNHVHCILLLDNSKKTESPALFSTFVGSCHGMTLQTSAKMQVWTNPQMERHSQTNQFSKPIAGSVSVILGQFKSSVTRWCWQHGHGYFNWQPRFHDIIIRDFESYIRIKQYIIDNPRNWDEDTLNNKNI